MYHRSQAAVTVVLLNLGLSLLVRADTIADCWDDSEYYTKLAASDGTSGNDFGWSTAIAGDTAVVSAYNNTGGGVGTVHVFRREGLTWTQVATLTSSDGVPGNLFGNSVAIFGDIIVVGAVQDDNANGVNAGSVYVFGEPDGGWGPAPWPMNEDFKLIASDGMANDLFGGTVGICGRTLAISAVRDDNENGVNAGANYVYRQYENAYACQGNADCEAIGLTTCTGDVCEGVTWVEEAKLLACDGVVDDYFGDCACSGDTIVIGATGDDDNGENSGSGYVFEERDGWENGCANQVAKLLPSDGEAHDLFGDAFGLAISGGTIAISAAQDDDWSGSAYMFEEPSSGWTSVASPIHETAKLVSSDREPHDWLGRRVAMSGGTVVLGAVHDDNSNGVDAGSMRIFLEPDGGWGSGPWPTNEDFTLLAPDGDTGDEFGYGIAIDGTTALVGAIYDDGNEPDSGSAYVFHGLSDCNGNQELDICDINEGASSDCNENGLPDDCQLISDECPYQVGDVNNDGWVDEQDLVQFVLVLLGLDHCGCTVAAADINGDGRVDGRDVGPFIRLLRCNLGLAVHSTASQRPTTDLIRLADELRVDLDLRRLLWAPITTHHLTTQRPSVDD